MTPVFVNNASFEKFIFNKSTFLEATDFFFEILIFSPLDTDFYGVEVGRSETYQ